MNNCKMEIVRCPLCNIMVSTERKSIVCKGCSSTWFHEKCAEMPDTGYDKFYNDTTSTRKLLKNNSKSNFHDLSSNKLTQLIDTLRLRKIEDAKDLENAEDKLVMAAEIGASLLDRVLQLEKQNSILQQKTASLSAVVEELKNEVNQVREREAHLVETIDGIHKQLDKEKAIRENMQLMFEEQDEKQEELIARYQEKICRLEKTIEKLNDIQNHNRMTDNDHDHHEIEKEPTNNSVNSKTDHEITNLLCKFKVVEHRLSTLEKAIIEDDAEKADKIFKKYLDFLTRLNITNQVSNCEQVLSQNQLGIDRVLAVTSKQHQGEIGDKVTVTISPLNEQTVPSISATNDMSLNPDYDQIDYFSKQVDSDGKNNVGTLERKTNKQVRIPLENLVTKSCQEANQPRAVTYLKGEKYILGVNKKKDKGIFKQGCRIFINPFTNKS